MAKPTTPTLELTGGQMAAAVSEAASDRLAVLDQEGFAGTLERLALDPRVDVAKIEKLLDMAERVQRRNAEQAFNVALSAAQRAMRRVAADADNPQTKSRYATYAALDRVLRPIYTDHGFGLSFDTGDSGKDLEVRVICLVTHVAGFSRTYHLDMPADGKGAKGGDVMTRTHATGSAVTYGMRYLLKMIWNVAIGSDRDDDGNDAGTSRGDAPVGFDDWFSDLAALADEGWTRLSKAWNDSRPDLKNYVVKSRSREWNDMKVRAQKVVRG